MGPLSPQGRPLAEWWKRAVAAVIDGFVVGIPATIILAIVGAGAFASADCQTVNGITTCDDPTGAVTTFLVSYLVILVLMFAYQVFMNGSERGQTVGKMVMKIQVRDEQSGGPIGYGKAFLRVLVAGVLGFFCAIGSLIDILFPLWDPKRQTIHDKAVSSLVVETG